MKWIERDGKVAVTLPAKLAGSTEPIALQFDTPLPKQNKSDNKKATHLGGFFFALLLDLNQGPSD